jgi:hypothetical protein
MKVYSKTIKWMDLVNLLIKMAVFPKEPSKTAKSMAISPKLIQKANLVKLNTTWERGCVQERKKSITN